MFARVVVVVVVSGVVVNVAIAVNAVSAVSTSTPSVFLTRAHLVVVILDVNVFLVFDVALSPFPVSPLPAV